MNTNARVFKAWAVETQDLNSLSTSIDLVGYPVEAKWIVPDGGNN